ncbi:uncharacterized protein LOC127812321 [Diospyros lotus]|uniref:uncharacterized protein LOC127812321 n=1 Tax=Diospyros lotus TaxID=55363 RepID=UPI00224DA367|nr:uncharacterized protein LOC127812321 [Diospyros lotus]
MLSLKVALISTGVLCMAVMFKLSAPAVAEFSLSDVTAIWSSLIAWLRPPYLYVVINCIILTLVASSKLQQKKQYKSPPETVVQGGPVSVSADYGAVYDGVVQLNEQPEIAYGYGAIAARGSEYKSLPETVVQAEPVKVSSDYGVYGGAVPVDDQPEISYGYDAIAARGLEYKSPPETVVQEAPVNFSANYGVVYGGVVPVDNQPEIVDGYRAVAARDFDIDADVHVDAQVPEIEIKTITLSTPFPEDESEMAKPSSTPQRNSQEYSLSPAERPPVSARFGHRRTVKSTPEGGGKTLRVSKPKRQETLESTWKTITEGRHMPLTRHLRKSDTWETHGRGGHHLQPQDYCMTKSQTFDAPAGSAASPPFAASGGKLRREPSLSGKLRRDPSPSQDELNRRVEAFIKKFNEDIRLQRQESLNQYMEMISRGAH